MQRAGFARSKAIPDHRSEPHQADLWRFSCERRKPAVATFARAALTIFKNSEVAADPWRAPIGTHVRAFVPDQRPAFCPLTRSEATHGAANEPEPCTIAFAAGVLKIGRQ